MSGPPRCELPAQWSAAVFAEVSERLTFALRRYRVAWLLYSAAVQPRSADCIVTG
jgi:hypothetical protein